MMKMMKRSSPSSSSSLSLLYVMVISLVCAVSAQSSFDCGSSALNSLLPQFISLSVFPNPVRVGQQVHIHTVVNLPSNAGFNKGDITDGQLSMDLSFKDTLLHIVNIPLCNASSAIDCSTLGPGENAISFDYLVPVIPAGKYSFTLRAKNFSSTIGDGCLIFSITVEDPDAAKDMYVSWIEAELAGASQFEHADYMQRSLNEYVQVGPIGDIDPNTAYTFPWGTFISLKGSGDFVQPYFVPAGYVWGLHGDMVQIVYQNSTRSQLYQGHFYVGYVSSLAKRTLDIEILTGTFDLTWNYTTDADGVVSSTLTGSVSFDSPAELPFGFSNPITVGRLVTANIFTDDDGILKMSGTQNVCLGDPYCNAISASKNGGDGLTGWQIGLITAVIVGVAIIFIVVISVWKWHRRSRRHEEEDGIFAVRRKPEYGNALVVDDIIQETREHSPNIMPPLARRDADYSDSDSDSADFSRSRSRSRTPSRSRSPSPYSERSKSRSRSRSAGGSDSESDYSGSSADRA